ncbi:MAG: hypothetical protein FJZ10_06760 [Candidatus Omnitrophica bacterium]|nr:hypothetical protein [Candidatus Omnitrophota bacterium]
MRKFIGIEIDKHLISFVNLAFAGKRMVLLGSGKITINPEEPSSPETAKKLAGLLKEVDLFDTKIISTITSPKIAVREMVFPQMANHELMESVKWKIKEHLMFPVEEAIIDAKIIEKITDGPLKRLRVLVVAVPQDVVADHIHLLRQAGVTPHVTTIAPLALENFLEHQKIVKKEVVATLEIAPQGTAINIYRNRKLCFTRTITPKLDRLPAEVKLSFDYFLEESHGSKVEKIIFFGEKSVIDNTANVFEQQLQSPVELIDPLKDIDIKFASENPQASGGLVSGYHIAVALGAALSYNHGISLLPEKIKRETKDYLFGAGARIVAIFGIFLFIFMYFIFKFNVDGYQDRLAVAQAEVASLDPLILNIEPLESLDKEVQQRLALANSLVRRNKVWSGVLKQLSRVKPKSITLNSLTVGETEISMQGSVSNSAGDAENILSRFIVALEKGIFKEVSLTNAQKYEEAQVLDFNLNSKLDF